MERQIISILITLLTLNVYAQTDLESLLFKKINDYRVEKGLNRLKWDEGTYKSTQIHTKYMVKNKTLCHTENSETPDFTDRIRLFSDKKWSYGIENVNMVSTNHTDNSIDEISDEILLSWKNSKPHNKAMLGLGLTEGAVSCGDSKKEVGWDILDVKYSTLVLWEEPIPFGNKD